jgi:hypothetical protein
MSQQGTRAFYQLTDTLKTQLLADINVHTVTTGDISEVNLQKQTIFPLSHIIVNTVDQEDGVLRFNVSILAMDIVNQSKTETVDIFEGNNDLQDILNTQLGVLNKLVQILRKGSLHSDAYQLEGDANLEPFYDRFENGLAGWTATMDVLIYNDINIC